MPDTDKELLERAARAAGLTGYRYCESHDALILDNMDDDLAAFATWNPSRENGDALWLAVKLNINIEHLRAIGSKLYREVCATPSGRGDCLAVESVEQGHEAATRRAIVRAAASLCQGGEGSRHPGNEKE